MANPSKDQAIHRIGMEIESVVRGRAEIIDSLPWKAGALGSPIRAVTRDASVESVMARINGRGANVFMGNRVLSAMKRGSYSTDISGFEIVTNPLGIREMRDVIRKCLNALVRYGEIYSPRSSIHIHIEYPRGLIFFKTAVMMGLKVEPLLYKIAGMGREYRGSINNSIYAKPLSIPPAIKLMGENEFVTLDPRGAVETSGSNSFWNKFGVSPLETHRYHPLRYFGVNIYSQLMRGTIEYRVFNFCSVPRYVEAVVTLCQFLSELMVRASVDEIKKFPDISLVKENPDKEYIDLLEQLMDLGDFYDCTYSLNVDEYHDLIDLVINTPQPIFKMENVITHVPNYEMERRIAQSYGLTFVKSAVESGIVDIHNFNQSDRSLI